MSKVIFSLAIFFLFAGCRPEKAKGTIVFKTSLEQSAAPIVTSNPLYADTESFERLLEQNKLVFFTYGLISHNYAEFEKKYGVRIKSENCVIPPSIQPITKNNLLIAEYLTKEYGDGWKAELPLLPLGVD